MGGNGLIPLGLLLGTLALVAATALAVRAVPTGRPSLRDAPPAEAFSSPATR